MALNGKALEGVTSPPSFSVGDRLSFTLEKTPRVRELRVASGDLSHLDGFSRLARPKRIGLTFADRNVEFELKDEPGLQRFPVDASGEGPIALEVLEIYPGTDSDEIAIWRLEFGTESAPSFVSFSTLQGTQPTTGDPAPADGGTTETTTIEKASTAPSEPTERADSANNNHAIVYWGAIAALVIGATAGLGRFIFVRARGG